MPSEPEPAPPELEPQRFGSVNSVLDGDSLVLATAEGELLEIRLDGINAPDREECYFDEARSFLENRVAGAEVGVATAGVDQFGRTLATVWVDDQIINLELVAEGMAISTTPGPGEPLGERYLEVEQSAKESGVGLWGPRVCGASGPRPMVFIDDVVHDPDGPDDQDLASELVKIVNVGDSEVNLSGWTLRDESSRHRYGFESNATLGAGGEAIIRSTDPGWEPGGSPVWNNDGDIVMLLDNHGRVVDSVRY